MIDYNSFHRYLCELVELFQKTQSLKGMSNIARKWHCTALTKEQFFKMNLDKMTVSQVTPQYSRMVRDVIGKHDAKMTLRDTIGRLATDFLRDGKVSQGSDRMVQITITQSAQPLADSLAPQKKEAKAAPLPLYKPGQIVFRKGRDGGMLHLVSKIEGDRFFWSYETMKGEDGVERVYENTVSSSYLGNPDIRLAKGNEVARFLGALTRSGYRWKADNTNGLFYVLGKEKESKPVDVFANDLPLNDYENTGIHPLPSVGSSPYRYALGPLIPIDNGGDYMSRCYDVSLLNSVVRQIKTAFSDFDHIREMFQYDMPALCCSEEIKEYRVALVKDDNNGTCYWLARDRDVLRLLSWVAFNV